MNKKDTETTRLSPLASIDLLDSRTSQEREAERVEGRIATIWGECWIGGHTFDLEAFADRLAAEMREAIEVERQACLQIIEDYNNLHPIDFVDKYQCDGGVIGAIRNRR